MKKLLLALGMAISLFGCDDPQLKILADPWLADSAKEAIKSYSEAHSDQPEPELKILSTEFILQQIKYGQPVDLAFIIDANYPEWTPQAKLFTDRQLMGGDAVVWVETLGLGQKEKFQSDSCLVLAPADSPLRRIGQEWKPNIGQQEGRCVQFPQMPELVGKYLVEGWVQWGLVWKSFAEANSASMKILSTGPSLDDLYWAALPATSTHPDQAREFLEFLPAQK